MGVYTSVLRTVGHPGKILAISIGVGGLVLGASGVLTSLVAQSTANQTVSSGTLKLGLSSGTGSAGFTTSLGTMKPGSTVRRLVTLTQTGSLPGSNLGMTITSDNNALTQALTVAVVTCTATGYPCTPTNTVLPATQASTLNGSSTQSVATAVTVGQQIHLQVTFVLPALAPAVTTVDGALAGYQNVSGNVSFAFEQSQEPATTTNS